MNGLLNKCGKHLLGVNIRNNSSGIRHERQMRRVVRKFVAYNNNARPHQRIEQVVPNCFHEPLPNNHAPSLYLAEVLI